jgi:hypothetical protein
MHKKQAANCCMGGAPMRRHGTAIAMASPAPALLAKRSMDKRSMDDGSFAKRSIDRRHGCALIASLQMFSDFNQVPA